MRAFFAAVSACLLTVLLAVPAFGAPAQASVGDVLTALSVSQQPSDYVVLVDTSASMTDQGRYDKVKSALTSMLRALQPADRVALVTFDTTAQLRFDGTIGSDPLAALGKLPAQPTGQNTDIGAGIDAGLKVLEGPTAKNVGAIALVTDGKVDAPGSPYATPGSAAWVDLKRRADAISARHEIAAYALGLVNTTDAALLHQVFAKAVDVQADQFSARLGTLQQQLLTYQAAEKVRPDLAHGVTASWSGIDWTKLRADTATLTPTLTLTSSYTTIPVTVSGLTAKASGRSMTVAGLPAEVTLAPGASVALPVTLQLGGAAAVGAATVTVTGQVQSSWSDVLTKDLGLTFRPTLTTSAQAGTAPQAGPSASAQLPLLPIAGALAACVVVGLVIALRSRPRLHGSLAISHSGRLLREFVLRGRSADLADPSTPGLSGTVSPAGRKDASAVSIKGRSAHERARFVLGDGEGAAIGDYLVTYTAQHSRSMSMIIAGLDEQGA